MSVAQLPSQLRQALASGGRDLLDPGTGGTVDLRGKDFMLARNFGAGTYKLPSLDAVDVGATVTVIADGNQTWNNAAGTTIGTLASGEVGIFVCSTTSSWAGTILAASAAVEINTAADVPIADAGGYFTTDQVEAALQALGKDGGRFGVTMTSFVDADGDPLAKFADNASPNPGFALANAEAFGIRWNDNGTQNQPVLASCLVPPGADGKMLTAHVIASKIGATVGDATTFTLAVYQNIVGGLHDVSSNIGGATSAMTGNATSKTVQHLTRALDVLDLGGQPAALTCTITPTSGTLGTDDVIVHGVYFTYPL
jgi:hypothetical protein